MPGLLCVSAVPKINVQFNNDILLNVLMKACLCIIIQEAPSWIILGI